METETPKEFYELWSLLLMSMGKSEVQKVQSLLLMSTGKSRGQSSGDDNVGIGVRCGP